MYPSSILRKTYLACATIAICFSFFLSVGQLHKASAVFNITPACYFSKSIATMNSYAERQHPASGNRPADHAMDIQLGSDCGNDLRALAVIPGKVYTKKSMSGGQYTGFGYYIELINTDLNLKIIYGHLSADTSRFPDGTNVRAGTHIANIGSTGNSTGPHIHMEVKQLSPETWHPNSAWLFAAQTINAPIAADFDGDGISDPASYNPMPNSNEMQWVAKTSSSRTSTLFRFTHGLSSDIPVPGDYDGDGKDDLGIYRKGTWIVLLSSNNYSYANRLEKVHGDSGDQPVPGDYDGDGTTDLGIYRQGTWIVLKSSNGYSYPNRLEMVHGFNNDIPVPGYYDTDNMIDLGIYRSGNWIVLLSSQNYQYAQRLEKQHGGVTDVPVPGDYDGDSKADLGIYRQGTWIVFLSTKNYSYADRFEFVHGFSTDIPMTAIFKSGDNKTDLGIFRGNNTWIILLSEHQYDYSQRIEVATI